jgi:hypothetical protein
MVVEVGDDRRIVGLRRRPTASEEERDREAS